MWEGQLQLTYARRRRFTIRGAGWRDGYVSKQRDRVKCGVARAASAAKLLRAVVRCPRRCCQQEIKLLRQTGALYWASNQNNKYHRPQLPAPGEDPTSSRQ